MRKNLPVRVSGEKYRSNGLCLFINKAYKQTTAEDENEMNFLRSIYKKDLFEKRALAYVIEERGFGMKTHLVAFACRPEW